MGRSSDSEDSRDRRSKKKKSKKSRSKSRSKSRERKRAKSRSRDRRSRSGNKSKTSRSRDRRSRSRDKRSKSRDRRDKKISRRSRSLSRQKYKSRSRSRRRSRSRGRAARKSRSDSRPRRRSSSKPKAYKSRDPSSSPDAKKEEINLTLAEELRRQKQIEEIESESFVQQNFRTEFNRLAKTTEKNGEVGFEFGTSAEVAGKAEAKSKLDQLSSEGLLNPQLFGDQRAGKAKVLDDSDDDDNEEPAERERRRQLEEEDKKRRLIAEIAQNWDARVEESARKHKSLALIIEAKEEEKQRKAELLQRKWGKKEAPEAGLVPPHREEPDPVEENTWKERWLQDQKVKQVYTSSKILSKTKQKLKQLEQDKVKEKEERLEQQQQEVQEAKKEEPHGIIGSIQEYANLVGKSMKQLAEAKYEPPEESESEDEGGADEDEGNLWGAILGGAAD